MCIRDRARHLDLAAVPRMVPALVQKRERLDKVRRRAITPVPGAAVQGIRPLAVLLPEVLHRIKVAKRRVDQRVRRWRRALLAKAQSKAMARQAHLAALLQQRGRRNRLREGPHPMVGHRVTMLL